MTPRRSHRSAATRAVDVIANASSSMSRPRRSAGGTDPAIATLSRDPPSSPANQQSLRLTVKLGSSKLKEATGGATSKSGRPSVSVNSRDAFVGGEIMDGKRPRNVKKSYVLDSDSDEEDEEMDDVADDDDGEGESIEEDEMEEDAEGEDDAELDTEMDLPPPPPIIQVSKNGSNPVVKVKPAGKSDGKTVAQKEAGSDDDLSELDSDMDPDETMQVDIDEDAEGEDEEIEVEDDDEDGLDSDEGTPANGSRASTPDLAKLTKRQRARLEEGGSGHLLALPDEVQVKKHLTAEEHAMRRAEMARRRKNLSEKRNEEEKMETINKLLKKQAPKTNARRRDLNGEEIIGDEPTPPSAIFTRWVSNKDGNTVGVPGGWLDGPVGSIFNGGGRKIVQEVE